MMKVGSALSFGVWALVLGGVGYFFISVNAWRETEKRLREELARLTAEERVAKVVVHSLDKDEKGRDVVEMTWAELDRDGHVREDIPQRHLSARGRVVYFGAHQIIFEDDDIRRGDPLRGKALTLFSRVWGEDQTPRDGQRLDLPPGVGATGGHPPELADSGVVPPAYRVSTNPEEAEFEVRMWREFWKLCNDPRYARSEGVKAVQLTAVAKEMIPGREYHLIKKRDGQILIDGPFPTVHRKQ